MLTISWAGNRIFSLLDCCALKTLRNLLPNYLFIAHSLENFSPYMAAFCLPVSHRNKHTWIPVTEKSVSHFSPQILRNSYTDILINIGLTINGKKILGRTLSRRAHISLLYCHTPYAHILRCWLSVLKVVKHLFGCNSIWQCSLDNTKNTWQSIQNVITVFWWILAKVCGEYTNTEFCLLWAKCFVATFEIEQILNDFCRFAPVPLGKTQISQENWLITRWSWPHWIKQDLPCMTQQ